MLGSPHLVGQKVAVLISGALEHLHSALALGQLGLREPGISEPTADSSSDTAGTLERPHPGSASLGRAEGLFRHGQRLSEESHGDQYRRSSPPLRTKAGPTSGMVRAIGSGRSSHDGSGPYTAQLHLDGRQLEVIARFPGGIVFLLAYLDLAQRHCAKVRNHQDMPERPNPGNRNFADALDD